MAELRDKIAELVAPHLAEDDWGDGLHLKIADDILEIPEIAEALKLAVVKPLNLGHSISTGTRKDD